MKWLLLFPLLFSITIHLFAQNFEFEENKGNLPCPLNEPEFKEINYSHYCGLGRHEGVSFVIRDEQSVKAIAWGEVRQVLVDPVFQTAILINHNNDYYTFIYGLSESYVNKGEVVVAGAEIGSIKPIDNETMELHFQIWKGTAKLNPKDWLICATD